MLPSRLLKRLSQLNRQRIVPASKPAAAPHGPNSLPQLSSALPAWTPAPTSQVQLDPQPGNVLHGKSGSNSAELPAGEVVETKSGCHYHLVREIARIWPDWPAFWAKRAPLTQAWAQTQRAEVQAMVAEFPQRTVLLDLETCGFAGSMVFLVGIVHWSRNQLVLSQKLARTYAEEASILDALWQITQQSHVLVTYNGKSFDWPMVKDRRIRFHLPIEESLTHCDLLHVARRRWKHRLPNCKLQTLERYICGRRRSGDIPGSQIPQAYHRFVRSQDATQIREILHHNALDLVTLLQLMFSLGVSPEPA